VSLLMYERLGHEGRRPSPFSWRIRYALAHKGVPVEFRLVRFADVETIRGLSGQHMVPILCDDDRVIHDSWNIAIYLEKRFPEHPSLFGGDAGRGLARLANHWADHILAPAIRRLIAADFILCLAPEDRDYYRRSRETAFGCTLEEYCADRPRWLGEFNAVVAPLERTLSEQPYLAGPAPSYADYLVFSVFQYARLGCPDEFVAEGTALRTWRDNLAASFDGLGNRYPGYPTD
jgi:glutathione S-transferase